MIHLSTNVGYKINQIQAMVPDYDKVCYDDKDIEIILSPTNLVKKYRVTYDSHQDDAFTIYTIIRTIKFRRKKQEIYVLNTTYNTEDSNVVTTVEDNMAGFKI